MAENNQIRNLKIEVRRLRERVDKLEQITSLLLQIDDHLFDYIDDTAKHVIRLEKESKK